MPLATYGVLKCRALDRKIDPSSDPSPHYQVLVDDGHKKLRIAVNVKSQESPSDLLYLVDDAFQHPILSQLVDFNLGFHKLKHQPGGVALDFIRGNLFHPEAMKPLPPDLPGLGNDLKELIDLYIQRAIQSEEATLYAFGASWGPEASIRDKYFGFLPGGGIHDIHMNQGSIRGFQESNGVYQDGGLLIHFPDRNQWTGIFLAFQSQCFHTDDRTGDAIKAACEKPVKTDVQILAALVNPIGADSRKQSVTLMNISPDDVNLNGWALADRQKRKYQLGDMSLKAGDVITIPLTNTDAQLSNNGSTITLLNPQGIKVHGVSYTKEQAQQQGWTIVF
ncbi:MAG: DUF2278 family protein [Oscillatoriophycideae cyanobacterium NC_groundwater_1537_Pr4_S-0.65um_50_18]|nr:DUF2278 family protein [Oscillatoriophycideae cyanobacterium NC_groundwater_1537_Pr4_S-0.65um_50_18]